MRFKKFIAALSCVAFLSAGLPSIGSAAMVSTQDQLVKLDRSASIATIEAGFARADVQKQLIAMGVDAVAAQERISTLSDHELQELASQFDALPAGSGIVGLIGAVFVVLLILEFLGVTDVFKNI